MRSRMLSLLVGASVFAACSGGDVSTSTDPSPSSLITTTAPTSTSTTSTTSTTTTIPTTTTAPSTTTQPALSEVPEGFKVFDGTANGFVIAVPVEWITLDLDAEDMEALVGEFGDQLPQDVAEQLPSMIEQGIEMFAVDAFSGDPEFAANVNVGVYDRGWLDDFELFEEVIPQQLEIFGADLQGLERVQLPGGEALRADYVLPVGDEYIAVGRQYWILSESRVYIVTFTDAEELSESDTFDAIIETFRAVA